VDAAGATGKDQRITSAEFARPGRGANSDRAGDAEQQLLVGMVEMQWKAALARRQRIDARAEQFAAETATKSQPLRSEPGLVVYLVPVIGEDVQALP